MPTETIEPQVQQALTTRDELIVEVRPIETEEDRQLVHALRDRADEWLKDFNVHEDRVCKPQYDAWKNSKRWFAEQRASVEKFFARLDAALKEDRRKQQEKIARQQKRENANSVKRHERAQASGKGLLFPGPVAPIVQDEGKRVEVAGKKKTWVPNWKGQIIDAAAVPRDLCSPDAKLILARIDSGVREIPGVHIYNDEFLR